MSHPGALAPFADARFAWFFAGRLISTAGSVMAPIALAFAVLDLTHSVVALGQVLAARSIPLILLLLVGGVVADRLPRALVLQVSHLASACTQGAVAYLVLTGQARLWQVALLEAINGAMTAFTMPAIQGLVPQVVDRGLMQQANALLAFGRSGLAVIGPAVAGVLVVSVGAGWALAFDALTWLLAALCMLFVRVPACPRERGTTMLAELRDGWGAFTSLTWLWTTVAACGVLNALHAGAWSTLGPVVAKSTDGLGEEGWGFAVSAEAVGLLAFTVVMMKVNVERPLRTGMAAMAALALPLFVLAAQGPLWLLLLAAFVAGGGVQVFMISWQTAIHENVPEHVLSRVSAYDALGSFVAIPLGQLLIGPISDVAGISATLAWSGVLFVAVVAADLGVRPVRKLRRAPARTADETGPEPAGPDRLADGESVTGAGRPVEGEAGA